MNANKLREFDTTDLKNQVRESEDQLFRLKFQLGMGQMDGVKKYRELRRDRARMLGVLRERELDPAKEAEAIANAAAAKRKTKKGSK